MFHYAAYGLSIQSALPLAELIQTEHGNDVLISLEAPRPLDEISSTGRELQLSREDAILKLRNVGQFRVRNGHEITVVPVPEADQRGIEIYILVVLLPIILYQRGFFLLHASAVEIDGCAVAFVGQPGQGKSSTAAALNRRGHMLISDDVVAVDLSIETATVLPGFPQIKLHAEVANHLNYSSRDLEVIHPLEPKWGISAKHTFSPIPLPLKAVYIIEDADYTQIEPIKLQVAFLELLLHLYVAHQAHDATGFHQLTRLLDQVPIYRLRRTRSLTQLSDLAHLVEQHTDIPVPILSQ